MKTFNEYIDKVQALVYKFKEKVHIAPNAILLPKDIYYDIRKSIPEKLCRYYNVGELPLYSTFLGLRIIETDDISDIKVVYMQEIDRA